jgi:diguanylate cyclase (GGDEF)-like protein/PAS domain S-box-containing protein
MNRTSDRGSFAKRHNRLPAVLICAAALTAALASVWFAYRAALAQNRDTLLFSEALTTGLMVLTVGLSLFMLARQHLADQSMRLLTTAIEQSHGAVMITDASGRIDCVNPRFTQITGHSREHLLSSISELVSNTTLRDQHDSSLQERLQRGEAWSLTMASTRRNGERFWQAVSAAPVRDEKGRLTHIVFSIEDTSQQRELHTQLERLAYFDPLTGLENRRMFRDRLDQALRHVSRHDTALALLFIDLDGFKQINDSLGHDAGDELLVAVAQRIRRQVREEDVVARLGGDEFIVLLSHQRDSHSAAVVARKILAALREPVALRGDEVRIGASIGITLAPEDGMTSEQLLRNADLAMYRAKDLGRNNSQYFSQDMHQRIGARQSLEDQLQQAIRDEQFVVHFQPLVDLREHRITGFEALARWQHAEGERLPGSFLGVAEQSGLIVALSEIILRKACQQLRELQQLGFDAQTVSVNLSARQFRDPGLIERIERILTQTGLDARWLELEITESMLTDDVAQAAGILQQLKALGVGIAIDDFGTGHSSLGTLSGLPVSKLKVDRSFVHNLMINARDRAITTAVIALGRQLELTVVAEGVETAEQSDFLLHHHCSAQQGYEFSAPVAFAELPGSIERLQASLNQPHGAAATRH